LFCNLPAVSIISTSYDSFFALATASKTTDAGSAPSFIGLTMSAPILSAQTPS